jgi:hypothetical protein
MVSPPIISGTPHVGGLLETSTGKWTPSAATFAYQWMANGVAIVGATGPALALGPSVVGKRMSVRVVARSPGFVSGEGTSASTSPVVVASVMTVKVHVVGHTVGLRITVRAQGVRWGPGRVRVLRNGVRIAAVSLVYGSASLLLRHQALGWHKYRVQYLGHVPVLATARVLRIRVTA